ncbi:hypothetical protein PTKIN_Ptkin12aG0013000 [Pterospermum kingtungense]
MIKAFAAGVILSTGFIHVLPEATESLTSPCLNENHWGRFPLAGLVAMTFAIGTLMVDAFATSHFSKSHIKQIVGDEEKTGEHEHENHIHVHTHATHGHSHGSIFLAEGSGSSELLRNRVISQVLELGIVVHSVIIGISLGASKSPKTIKPLMVALTFHQLFEGMGLGCISQAQFKARVVAIMATFFSLTTPIGIAIGIGISNIYDENNPKALIVEGIFNTQSLKFLLLKKLANLNSIGSTDSVGIGMGLIGAELAK